MFSEYFAHFDVFSIVCLLKELKKIDFFFNFAYLSILH